jgi:hypothetical protein
MKWEQVGEHTRCAGWSFLFEIPGLHLSGAVARKLGNCTLNGSENNSGHAIILGWGAEPVTHILFHNIDSSQKTGYLICLLDGTIPSFKHPLN